MAWLHCNVDALRCNIALTAPPFLASAIVPDGAVSRMVAANCGRMARAVKEVE
jgi:hypothetical protein